MVARVARCAGSTPFRASKPVVRRGEKANRYSTFWCVEQPVRQSGAAHALARILS